jgi:hypothetical protein
VSPQAHKAIQSASDNDIVLDWGAKQQYEVKEIESVIDNFSGNWNISPVWLNEAKLLLAELMYREWTRELKLRFSSYKNLSDNTFPSRADKYSKRTAWLSSLVNKRAEGKIPAVSAATEH